MREYPWHLKEEEFLGKIEKQCNAYNSYFSKDHQYYHALSSRFNIPILIVSSINALTAISLNEFLDQKFVSIMNAVLSAGVGILGSIQLYMKINEKMANALRSSILMKRLALKISKEMSIDRDDRSTEGQAFLQECFAEFNAALELANPIEKRISNFLALGEEPPASVSHVGSMVNMAAAIVSRFTPSPVISPGTSPRPGDSRAKSLWGTFGIAERGENSLPESSSPPGQSGSTPGEESPRVPDEEP
jgi:hypothetical protein